MREKWSEEKHKLLEKDFLSYKYSINELAKKYNLTFNGLKWKLRSMELIRWEG